MSYGQNGAYEPRKAAGAPFVGRNRYDEANGTAAPASFRTRREGGYAALETARNNQDPYSGPQSPESPDRFVAPAVPTWRRGATLRVGGAQDRTRIGSGEIGRNDRAEPISYGNGPGARQIDGALQHINERWSNLGAKDCVPVHLALQLMDYSSLGRGNDFQDFQQTYKALQKGLKAIVNEHHQGFNSSIGTYHKVQASIAASQSRVRALKDTLVSSRSSLSVSKPELRGMATSSQNYDEMLQLLAQIEKVQALPEQLDSYVSDKQFLIAVDVLQDGLRRIRHASLENIGALSDLRIYLDNQEASITDILVEELHDHVYLKSSYTQNRWTAYTPPIEGGTPTSSARQDRMKPLFRFLGSLDTSVVPRDKSSKHLEEDNFNYIHLLLEALNKMGKLRFAMDKIEQRLPVELYAVVERTNTEVDARHPIHLRRNVHNEHDAKRVKLSLSDAQAGVLNDFLYTLYSKFEAIADAHRAIHEITIGIAAREGVEQPEAGPDNFKELWNLLQAEMRSLLHDYLSTSDNLNSYNDHQNLTSNIFKRPGRNKAKRLFTLDTTPDKRASVRGPEQEALDNILQTSVPGLVSKIAASAPSRENNTQNGEASQRKVHKLLVDAGVFNITILLPPSLQFLQNLQSIVPEKSGIALSTLTTFLDDFLVNVFNPQFDETMTDLCSRVLSSADAFQAEDAPIIANGKPIFQGAMKFMELIQAFCRMLDAIPHDHTFSKMIIDQIDQFVNVCGSWFRTLVARTGPDGTQIPKRAASVLESGELSDCVQQLWDSNSDEGGISKEQIGELKQKEIDLIIAHVRSNPIEPLDLISDPKSVTLMCLLTSSMEYLAEQISQLRQNNAPSLSNAPRKKDNQRRVRWSLMKTSVVLDESQPVYLPLDPLTTPLFDNSIASIRNLSVAALFAVHLDIRFGVVHILSRLLYSNFTLKISPSIAGPDQIIRDLNNDLLNFDDTLVAHLPSRQYSFISQSLGTLVDNYVISAIPSHIKTMNSAGAEQMAVDILVLQQNLRSLEGKVSLARSATFFDLFVKGPKAIVETAKNSDGGKNLELDMEELKTLLELCYSEQLAKENSAQARRSMQDDILQVTEALWSM